MTDVVAKNASTANAAYQCRRTRATTKPSRILRESHVGSASHLSANLGFTALRIAPSERTITPFEARTLTTTPFIFN